MTTTSVVPPKESSYNILFVPTILNRVRSYVRHMLICTYLVVKLWN